MLLQHHTTHYVMQFQQAHIQICIYMLLSILETYIYVSLAVLGDEAVSAYHQPNMFNQATQLSWQVMGDNVLASLEWEEGSCLLD